jgi:hypothetical protein
LIGGTISWSFCKKDGKGCRFERQREIFLLNRLVLSRFLLLVEMTKGNRLLGIKSEDKILKQRLIPLCHIVSPLHLTPL